MILRWLFLILLVLNLLLFVWGYQQPQPEPEELPPLPGNAPPILLLGETTVAEANAAAMKDDFVADNGGKAGMEQKPALELNEESARSTDSEETSVLSTDMELVIDKITREAEKSCIKLGPFDREADTFDMMTALKESGHETSLEVKRTQEQSGFWVLIPPSSGDPDFLIANLELAGVEDVWRFNKGDLAGAVSLGLYSDKDRAEERKDELKEKGFSVEIHPRQLEQLNFWIETRYDSDDTEADTALEQLFNTNPRMSYPPPQCAENGEAVVKIQ